MRWRTLPLLHALETNHFAPPQKSHFVKKAKRISFPVCYFCLVEFEGGMDELFLSREGKNFLLVKIVFPKFEVICLMIQRKR
jgi:hypothetical protein